MRRRALASPATRARPTSAIVPGSGRGAPGMSTMLSKFDDVPCVVNVMISWSMLPDGLPTVVKEKGPGGCPGTVPENKKTFDPRREPTIENKVSPLFAAISTLENAKSAPPSVVVTALVLVGDPQRDSVPAKMLGTGLPNRCASHQRLPTLGATVNPDSV